MKSTERQIIEELGLLTNKEVFETWKLMYEVGKHQGKRYEGVRKEFAEYLQRVVGKYLQEQLGRNKVANRMIAMAFNDMDFIEIANEVIISSLFNGELR
jgi:hypothetical protein